MATFTFDADHHTLITTASGLNGSTISGFLPGDDIQITDSGLTRDNLNLTINGNVLTYDDANNNVDSFTIDNLGPGRLVVRNIGSGSGVDIRLQETAHNDFSGDGFSDVLWQNTNGTITDWLGQTNKTGAFVGTSLNITVPTNWHVVGTGDFNGDGLSDLLWRSNDGTVVDWFGQSNGSFVGNSQTIAVPTNWHVVGTGDFNGDGISDILWRSDDGTVLDWLGQSNGSFVGSSQTIAVPTNWHVVGTGDFNGDGHDDILWRSDDGTVLDWLGQSNGTFVGSTQTVAVPTNWHVVGTGDFNGDGISDILWRSDDGSMLDWLGQAQGGFVGNPAYGSTTFNPGTSWHVVGIGDYNGDSIDDLLLQNSSGSTTEWLGQTNGTFVSNATAVNGTVPTNWHVQDPFVHDPLVM